MSEPPAEYGKKPPERKSRVKFPACICGDSRCVDLRKKFHSRNDLLLRGKHHAVRFADSPSEKKSHQKTAKRKQILESCFPKALLGKDKESPYYQVANLHYPIEHLQHCQRAGTRPCLGVEESDMIAAGLEEFAVDDYEVIVWKDEVKYFIPPNVSIKEVLYGLKIEEALEREPRPARGDGLRGRIELEAPPVVAMRRSAAEISSNAVVPEENTTRLETLPVVAMGSSEISSNSEVPEEDTIELETHPVAAMESSEISSNAEVPEETTTRFEIDPEAADGRLMSCVSNATGNSCTNSSANFQSDEATKIEVVKRKRGASPDTDGIQRRARNYHIDGRGTQEAVEPWYAFNNLLPLDNMPEDPWDRSDADAHEAEVQHVLPVFARCSARAALEHDVVDVCMPVALDPRENYTETTGSDANAHEAEEQHCVPVTAHQPCFFSVAKCRLRVAPQSKLTDCRETAVPCVRLLHSLRCLSVWVVVGGLLFLLQFLLRSL